MMSCRVAGVFCRVRVLPLLVPGLLLAAGAVAQAQQVGQGAERAKPVTVYTYRQPFLIRPLMDEFTRRMGIPVRLAFARKGLLERLKAEGENTPADVVITVNAGRMVALRQAGLLRPVRSRVLEEAVPEHLRDAQGHWFALTKRARIIVAHKQRVKPGEVRRYADLAAPHLKGRVCMRSGKNAYNIGLIAAFIAHEGEDGARAWLRGVKANLARKPQGNDRAQARAIYEGQCDVALINSYYLGKMAANDRKPAQKRWAAALRVIFPDQHEGGRGTHVNITGGAVLRYAKNPEGGRRLLEFLVSPEAQRIFAAQNHEYPVRAGVEWSALVASWGRFREDRLPLSRIGALEPKAARLVDETGFDH